MQNLIIAINADGTRTMTSLELSKLCLGEKKDDHSNFVIKMKKVIGEDKLLNFQELVKYSKGERKVYNLPEREACLMAMSYSYELQAKVYDAWQSIKAPKPMTQLEILAGATTALVNHEKQLSEHRLLINKQAKQIEEIKESSMILPSKPVNAMSVTYIRQRINADYGLPARIINEVLYSIHYAPKPAGQVRNTNEHAGNSTYTVWNKSEVTKLFNRFISECEMATKTQAVHPSIDGRFKLVKNK